MVVIKRDGRVVQFDKGKIVSAVLRVFIEADGEVADFAQNKANEIADFVGEKKSSQIHVEEIQDIVERRLMASNRKDVAKEYIIYRDKRSWIRVLDEKHEFKNRGRKNYREQYIKARNPDFPNNYIKHIKENIGKYDYIFVSSHASVREALDKEGIDFTIVYPSATCFAEWIGRCFIRDKRGESGCNPNMLYDNWAQWINECIATGYNHKEIILESGQYLSDYMR